MDSKRVYQNQLIMKITRIQVRKWLNIGVPVGFLFLSAVILVIRFPVMSYIVDLQLKSEAQNLSDYELEVQKAEIQSVVHNIEKDIKEQKAINAALREEIEQLK